MELCEQIMPNQLELDIWRCVAGQTGLREVLERVVPVLATVVPFEAAMVRRLDSAHRRIETLAVASSGGHVGCDLSPSHVTSAAMDDIVAWCLAGDAAAFGPVDDRPMPMALRPPGNRDALLAAPLGHNDGPLGIIILLNGSRRFTQRHLRLASALQAPLATAFDADRRERETATLRDSVRRDHREVMQPLDISDSIVGAETGLREVMERVELVARTNAPVLILGETGSGKEVVARAIHARSHRATGPILRVNCGAIPPELVDSELFGHERGSFTGAIASRKGWFDRADGGTLFLDEVGELPLAAQVRLLRILQDGTFERVGGQHTQTVDIRVVTATNRDLGAMVAAGRFREDLWYRISVFPIHLPPLRERRDDIPALAIHFAGWAGRRLGVTPLVPSQDDLQALMDYDWPGNVRELAAVIERAAILGNGRRLQIATALGSGGRAAPIPPSPTDPLQMPLAPQPIESLDAAMARHIRRAVASCAGRIEGPSGAAHLLGINPHTLRARMRKLGVDWARFRSTGQAE
jgi:transcriptional regulator with GAF, ATPase, and Fis domain